MENIQRTDLNPVEEARAFHELQKKYNLTQEQIADDVGKSRPYVANALRLLKLPSEVKKLLTQGALSAGHAKVLLEVQDAELIKKLALLAADRSVSVAELSRLVKSELSEKRQKKEPYRPGPDIKRILSDLEKSRSFAHM